MSVRDSLENDLSRLAKSTHRPAGGFDEFKNGVWREIRHRQALAEDKTPFILQSWVELDWGLGRMLLAAACISIGIGAALGFLAAPGIESTRIAARNLDLGVFSPSAYGLPSNIVASRK